MYCISCDKNTRHTRVTTRVCYACAKIFIDYRCSKDYIYFVYKLYHNGRLVYIGVTRNLVKRLLNHCKTKRFDCMVAHKGFHDKSTAYTYESKILRVNKPFYNRKFGMKYEVMKRQKYVRKRYGRAYVIRDSLGNTVK